MAIFKFKPTRAKTIACYHCGRLQEVGERSITLTCQHCNKPLQVGDVRVTGYDARRAVQTVGSLVVEKKGQIICDRVQCGDLVVRGQLKSKGQIASLGKATLGPTAQVKGDVTAPLLTVAEGATIEGFCCVGKGDLKRQRAALLGEPIDEPNPADVDSPQASS